MVLDCIDSFSLLSFLLCICACFALFSHPNQDQLVISGHKTKICTGNCTGEKFKSVTFPLMGHLYVVLSSFLKCAKYMDYAMDIM